MSNKHVNPILAELLENISRPPRHTRQLHIETSIVDFYPDDSEAQEILAALTMVFQKRYGANEDIAHYSKYLSRAFERVATEQALGEVDECDLARDWRARKEG